VSQNVFFMKRRSSVSIHRWSSQLFSMSSLTAEAERLSRSAGSHPSAAFVVALPFLFPFATCPSVNVWQLLVSWSCAALFLALGCFAAPLRRILVWFAVVSAALLLSAANAYFKLAAFVAVLIVGVAACAGAALISGQLDGRRAFAAGLLLAGLVSAVLGLTQYYGFAEHLQPLTTAPDIGQAYGYLRQRNQFATLLNMALIALLWLYASTVDRRWWLAMLGAGCLLLVGQAASTSRPGILQLTIGAELGCYMARRERRHRLERPSTRAADPSFRLPPPWLLLSLIPLYFAIGWLLPHLTGGGVEGIAERLREGAPPGHSRLVL
jgi:hypothetical protein